MQNCYDKSPGKGRIPREELHNQQERLTTKHIHTLGFLQEIVNENKLLKEQVEALQAKLLECADIHKIAEDSQNKIQDVRASSLDRADEINAMLIDKHQQEFDEEMQRLKDREQEWKVERLLLHRQLQDQENEYEKRLMRQVEEKLQAERKWNDEKRRLKEEIKELEKTNKVQMREIDLLKKNERKLQMLNLKLDAVLQEVEDLKSDNEKNREINSNQLQEISRLRASKERLTEQLAEATQKIRQLESKIDRLDNDLSDVLNDTTKDEAIDLLKKKLTKLHTEKRAWIDKEKDYEGVINKLNSKRHELSTNLDMAESSRLHLQGEIDVLLQEIERLRRQLGGDRSFKNFVSLKREMNNIREENDFLKERVVRAPPELPMLKDSKRPPRLKSAKSAGDSRTVSVESSHKKSH